MWKYKINNEQIIRFFGAKWHESFLVVPCSYLMSQIFRIESLNKKTYASRDITQ